MYLHETIFCAAVGSISVHDLQTGSTLASFKQTNASEHCTCFVQSKNSQGGFILAAQPDKPVLNVYNFQKDQVVQKLILPEKLSCTALDPKGSYFAGGTANGRIYLWETASGILYNSWDAHYRKVNVLQFTHDGAALVSGSDDSAVSVWSVSRLLDDDLQNDLVIPYCTLSDHTLPVTDIVCGLGPFPKCRLLTSSEDHSAKLWDLTSKSLLTTFQFPNPISCLAWDLTERLFFAAARDGSIFQMNLFRERDGQSADIIEPIGGAGVTDVIRVDADSPENRTTRLMSVGEPITSMTISLTSTLLLVGTSAGVINIWDIASHQLLRTVTTHKGLSITCLATMLKPPDLVGHISLNLDVGSTFDARDVIPVKPVLPFQRVKDAKARGEHEVSILLSTQTTTVEDELDRYPMESILHDHAFFVNPAVSSLSSQDPMLLQNKISDLEAEVIRLREQLGAAKGINDLMWETVVQRVLRQQSTQNDFGHENGQNGARTA